MRTTFTLQRGCSSRETTAIVSAASWLGAEYRWSDHAEPGTVPVGTVEFCETLFGEHRRDFFPEFLRHMLCREIRSCDGPREVFEPVFAKRFGTWKDGQHPSRIRQAGEILPTGLWWLSEPVTFVQEWRYYVARGDLITTGWYAGSDEDEPAPKFRVEWPEDFSGAADFGRLDDGRIALVECHAPFACGWYGDDHSDYAFWQALAWEHRDWWIA